MWLCYEVEPINIVCLGAQMAFMLSTQIDYCMGKEHLFSSFFHDALCPSALYTTLYIVMAQN